MGADMDKDIRVVVRQIKQVDDRLRGVTLTDEQAGPLEEAARNLMATVGTIRRPKESHWDNPKLIKYITGG